MINTFCELCKLGICETPLENHWVRSGHIYCSLCNALVHPKYPACKHHAGIEKYPNMVTFQMEEWHGNIEFYIIKSDDENPEYDISAFILNYLGSYVKFNQRLDGSFIINTMESHIDPLQPKKSLSLLLENPLI